MARQADGSETPPASSWARVPIWPGSRVPPS